MCGHTAVVKVDNPFVEQTQSPDDTHAHTVGLLAIMCTWKVAFFTPVLHKILHGQVPEKHPLTPLEY